jgi:hypothetical protein
MGSLASRSATHAGLLKLDDLSSIHEPVAAVLFELPQREIGGQSTL